MKILNETKNIKTRWLKNSLLIAMLFGFISPLTYADDPLTLTPAEMQKLQHYFPNQDSGEHFVWKGNPIPIFLPLNQEKRIIFPESVTPDLKGALTTAQLRMINDHGSLYLTALKPFSKIRMFVRLSKSNDVVMLDLSTDAKADADIATIDLTPPKSSSTFSNSSNAQQSAVHTSQINNGASSTGSNYSNNLSGNDADVTLIRFAWQQLFAPDRLLSNPLNIARTPMHTSVFISDLVYGDKVIAHPLVSWQMNQRYVTAIELRNKYAHVTSLNIARDLCGHWEAAVLYPRSILEPSANANNTINNRKLKAVKRNTDSTVLFLISQQPFGDAMEVCHGIA